MIRTSLIFCLSYSRHTCNRSEFCSHVRFVVTNNTRWVLVITYYKFEDDHCEIRSLKLVYKRVSDGSGVISGTIIHARITQQSDTICTCSESMLLSPFTRHLCRRRTQSQRDSRKQSVRLAWHHCGTWTASWDVRQIADCSSKHKDRIAAVCILESSIRVRRTPCKYRMVMTDEIGRRRTGRARNRRDCGICGSTHRILLLTAGAIRL